MLLQAMLLPMEGNVEKVSHEIQKSKSMLEEVLSVLPLDGLSEAASYATQLRCILLLKRLGSLKYEGILLMHAENRLEDAFTNLWSFVQPFVVSCSSSVVSDTDASVLNAKACLKLSDWLRRDFSNLSLESIVPKILADFGKSDLASTFSNGNTSSNQNVVLIVEELVGTSTKLSSRLCPSLGKSWISYASWCYS
ncbi:hypothetical protein Vadar_003349 [Vaccinium darrowii]|uniref:Uncharacterized protein n=1 Tax=Vaccinium darrowii TaxID=229202 RepID=A0ACB7ZGP1_9ERIC|nr:hypothetical protein Vadar_003349 [Vaccinium darrowii]